MQGLLEQGQRVMGIGEDIRVAREVIRRLRKARQNVLEQQLEALLHQREAGSQGDDLILHLRIERAEGAPGRLGHRAVG